MLNNSEKISCDTKLKIFLPIWYEYHTQFIKESTSCGYGFWIHKHIIPILGDYKLKEISQSVLQTFALEKLKNGKLKGKGGINKESVKNTVMVLKLALDYAFKKGTIKPFNMDIRYPKTTKDTKVKVFTKGEQKKLTKHLIKNLDYPNIGILISLYCGIRIGELCALQWRDIDLYNKCVKIRKTLQRVSPVNGKSKVIIGKPKSNSSIRVVPIPDFLVDILKKEAQDDEFYVCRGLSKYAEPRTFREYYKKNLDTLGIAFKNFHSLRHTFATRCVEFGVDPKTISELMGHSTVNITLNLYVHANDEQKNSAVNLAFKNLGI